jgi:hypothetical protein
MCCLKVSLCADGCLLHAPLKEPKLQLPENLVVINVIWPLWSYDEFYWTRKYVTTITILSSNSNIATTALIFFDF